MCGIREETIAVTSYIAFQYNKLIQYREACVIDFTSDRNDHTGKKLSLWIEGHLLLEAWVICRQNILILLGEKENLSWSPICLLPWLPKSKIKFFCFQNHSKQTGSEQAWLYASCNLKSSISSFWFTSSDGAWQAWWIQSRWAMKEFRHIQLAHERLPWEIRALRAGRKLKLMRMELDVHGLQHLARGT